MISKLKQVNETMAGNNGGRCPKIYECTRIQMTPMIRTLRRCSAEEAMESICSNCADVIDIHDSAIGARVTKGKVDL
jgi:hypothetical protein